MQSDKRGGNPVAECLRLPRQVRLPPPGSTPDCLALSALQLQILDCPGPDPSCQWVGELPRGFPASSRALCRRGGQVWGWSSSP